MVLKIDENCIQLPKYSFIFVHDPGNILGNINMILHVSS